MEKKVLIGLSLLVGVLLVLNLVKGNKSTTQAVKPVPSQQKAQTTPPQTSPPPQPQALPLQPLQPQPIPQKEEEKLPSPVEEVKPQEKKEEKQDKREEKKQEVKPTIKHERKEKKEIKPQKTKPQTASVKEEKQGQAPISLDGYALVCVIGGDCALYKDGQTIKRGSELNGWTVERISPDGIELRKGYQVRKVRLP